jgi:DNA helicase-2/ATP-dependent DNA helicase PcrA
MHAESVQTTTLADESITELAGVEMSSHKKFENNEYQDLMVHEAKNVLLKKGLSVTALNHFLECPSKFLYESILKLPQAPSASAEKGTAMHEAIRTIWSTRPKTEADIAETISSVITEHIDGSLISPIDKETLKTQLATDAPVVAKALFGHFTVEGTIMSERWIEIPFDGVYMKEKITIPLHGKLDAMIDTGNELGIFDYKTRQAMSVAAIKGETKNDEGNYFRQLIFYKLLTEQNSFWQSKKINTSLVFVSPDEKGRCPIITLDASDTDVQKVKEEIQSLINSVWSGDIAQNYCSDSTCIYCGYRRLLLS